MIKLIFGVSIVILFTACLENKPTKHYNSKKLIEQKCSSCHNLNMPPIISDDELAPPMMAVAFHVKNFVTPTNESQRISKSIEFVVDYVQHPALEKSFCDKDSLKRYGLMPSQKDNITVEEIKAVATYIFQHFTQENLSIMQEEKAKYDALSPAKRIALKNGCLGCHKIDKKIVGPSFKDIAQKYKGSTNKITNSIKNGTNGKWEDSHGAIMPAFKNISDKELEILSSWILNN